MTVRPQPEWRPPYPPVNAETLDSVLGAHRVVVVHFWAVWDGYDPILSDRLESLLPQFQGRLVFAASDIDDDQAVNLAIKYSVVNIATLLCFVRGDLYEQITGLRPTEAREEILARWAEAA